MKKLSLNDPLFAPMTNESLKQFKGGMMSESDSTTKWTYSQTHDQAKNGCADTNNDGYRDGNVILDVTTYNCEGEC